MQWRPIETAPKDGTQIIAYWDGSDGKCKGMACLSWDTTYHHWKDPLFWRVCFPRRPPTHWMPLPEPQEEEK